VPDAQEAVQVFAMVMRGAAERAGGDDVRTVQEIFDEAIHLIDAQNEQTGATNTTDTKEYEVRAAKLLSTLLNEAYPYSDTYSASDWEKGDYAEGESVVYEGRRYLCIEDTDGADALPTDTTYWRDMGKAGKRPTHPSVTGLTDSVFMDDFICLTALPAGLAALFVYDEDTTKYNAFWGDYMNRLAQARATLPASDGFEEIENPYAFGGAGAGIEYGRFGRWANM